MNHKSSSLPALRAHATSRDNRGSAKERSGKLGFIRQTGRPAAPVASSTLDAPTRSLSRVRELSPQRDRSQTPSWTPQAGRSVLDSMLDEPRRGAAPIGSRPGTSSSPDGRRGRHARAHLGVREGFRETASKQWAAQTQQLRTATPETRATSSSTLPCCLAQSSRLPSAQAFGVGTLAEQEAAGPFDLPSPPARARPLLPLPLRPQAPGGLSGSVQRPRSRSQGPSLSPSQRRPDPQFDGLMSRAFNWPTLESKDGEEDLSRREAATRHLKPIPKPLKLPNTPMKGVSKKSPVSCASAQMSPWKRLREAVHLHAVAKSMSLDPEWLRSAYAVFKEFARMQSSRSSAVKAGLLRPEAFREVIAILAGMDADQLEDEAIEDAFQEADADGNKNIDFLEFASWLMRHNFDEFLVAHNREERQSNRIIANKLGMTFVEVENYRAKFNHFDADGSGTIDKDEFLQLLSTTMKVSKENIPASRVHTWWRAADLDGNGHIDFEEFIKFHKKFFGATINGTTNLDTIYRTGGLMDLIPSKERAPARPSRTDRTPRPQ